MPRTPPTVSTMLLVWVVTGPMIVPLADGTTGDGAADARAHGCRDRRTGGAGQERRQVQALRRGQLPDRRRLLLLRLEQDPLPRAAVPSRAAHREGGPGRRDRQRPRAAALP